MKKTNKKAIELLDITLVNLIFIGFILITFLVAISKISDNTIHFERAKASDLAMTYSAASIAQNNLYLVYNAPETLSLALSKTCKIEVQGPEQKPPSFSLCLAYDPSTNLKLKEKTYSIEKNV